MNPTNKMLNERRQVQKIVYDLIHTVSKQAKVNSAVGEYFWWGYP